MQFCLAKLIEIGLLHMNIMYQKAMCPRERHRDAIFLCTVLLVKVSEGSRPPCQNLNRYSRRLLLTNSRKKMPITRGILALKAKTIGAENGIVNFEASGGWVDNFMEKKDFPYEDGLP